MTMNVHRMKELKLGVESFTLFISKLRSRYCDTLSEILRLNYVCKYINSFKSVQVSNLFFKTSLSFALKSEK